MIDKALMDEFEKISLHMFELGKYALSHAIWMGNYNHYENIYHRELGFLHAAHATELIIKSCIAKAAHPLLVFDSVPKSTSSNISNGISLIFSDMVNHGRTINMSDLPERLWSSTGYKIENIDAFKRFVFLRNAMQHCAVPEGINPTEEMARFIFPNLDDIIHHFWDSTILDCFVEDDMPGYCIGPLVHYEVPIRRPEWADQCWWPEEHGIWKPGLFDLEYGF